MLADWNWRRNRRNFIPRKLYVFDHLSNRRKRLASKSSYWISRGDHERSAQRLEKGTKTEPIVSYCWARAAKLGTDLDHQYWTVATRPGEAAFGRDALVYGLDEEVSPSTHLLVS